MPNLDELVAQADPWYFQKKRGSPIKKKDDEEMTPITAREGFTFGCDPECFIKDPEGRYVPAEGIVPGSKASPHPVEGGAVQVDGLAAEFNTDPAKTFEEFSGNIDKVLKALKGYLPKGYTLDFVPSVRFDGDVFEKSSDASKELGCSPDVNAWTGGFNPPPELPEDPTLRCAGGHLHFGWTENADMSDLQHILACQDLVKQLDWYLAAWSLKHDTDTLRRSLYGKAGSCRYKPYGVEYRTLSNFWVTNKKLRLEVWNRMNTAIFAMIRGYIPEKVPAEYNGLLVQSINSSQLNPVLSAQLQFPINTLQVGYANSYSRY